MPFKPNDTKNKKGKQYKSIYISQEHVKMCEVLATKYGTSFNNVAVSMIEYAIANLSEEDKAYIEKNMKK